MTASTVPSPPASTHTTNPDPSSSPGLAETGGVLDTLAGVALWLLAIGFVVLCAGLLIDYIMQRRYHR